MVHVVMRENKVRYEDLLPSMFEDRKRVFVDRMKWKVPVVDGRYEIDQFDTDDAIYLVDIDSRTQRHRGSTRLLPTTRPHILDSLFSDLCDRPPPVGEDIWEITRLCTAPHLDKDESNLGLRRLKIALIEFGLLYGITRYTLVSFEPFLTKILSLGWECAPLGPLRVVDGLTLGAAEIRVSSATLQMFRLKAGSRAPVVEIIRPAVAA